MKNAKDARTHTASFFDKEWTELLPSIAVIIIVINKQASIVVFLMKNKYEKLTENKV